MTDKQEVTYTGGGGRFTTRAFGLSFARDETKEVESAAATYLAENHDFERAESDADASSADDSGGSDAEDGAAPDSLTDLPGVGVATADQLREAGYDSVPDVRAADPAHLADEVDNIGDELAADLTDETAREKAQDDSEGEA